MRPYRALQLDSRLSCNETLSNAKNYESYVSIRSGNELFKKSFINRHKRRSTLGMVIKFFLVSLIACSWQRIIIPHFTTSTNFSWSKGCIL